jgi:hypothetical protein
MTQNAFVLMCGYRPSNAILRDLDGSGTTEVGSKCASRCALVAAGTAGALGMGSSPSCMPHAGERHWLGGRTLGWLRLHFHMAPAPTHPDFIFTSTSSSTTGTTGRCCSKTEGRDGGGGGREYGREWSVMTWVQGGRTTSVSAVGLK